MESRYFWGRKYSAREIAEAKVREDVIRRWQGGEKLSLLIKGIGIKLTRAGWWLVRRRYKKDGLAGLLDRRNGRKSLITLEVEGWVKEALEGRESLGRIELQEMLKERFGLEISLVHISRLIRKVGVRRKRGGQKKEYTIDAEKGIPIDHVGVYFLKGADSDMEGVKTITEGIVKGREKEIDEKSALGRIRGTTPDTIKKKVETLLYLPMFGMQKPYHLLKYHKRGLGLLTGSGTRYSYYTTEIFLGDIEKLRISKEIGDGLARCYLEALCIEIELEDGSYFYIDGHAKHVWSSKNIPKAFFSTLKRMERGLHQYFIHSTKGDPLILLTCPGDTRLPGVMLNLIDAFENAVGKRIVKAAIFDREGLSLSIFEEFDEKKKYFITLLREGMYKGIDSFKILKEFIPLKTEEKDGKLEVLVAEAEYLLKDRKKKRERIVRVALVRKQVNERMKLIPIITNLTQKEESDIRKVAKRYFDRWPNQENIFKDAMESFKVDTNHGYKKEKVANRVVERKKEELETNLRGINQRLNKAVKEREKAGRVLSRLTEVYQSRKQIYEKEINELYARLGLGIKEEERKEYLFRVRDLEKRLRKMVERYAEVLPRWEIGLKNKEQHEKSLRTQKENKEREIKGLNLEEALYEIKTEKDHLMSNIKMLLINLSSYTQRQYFPESVGIFTMESMMKAFYQQDGYVKIRKKRIDVTIHSYDEPDLQKAVEYACAKFNNSDLRTPEGQRIWMWVERQKCQVLNDN
jgi:hypothetical protein